MSIFFTRYQCLARSVLVYVAFVHINTWFGGPQAILVLRVLEDTSPDFSVRSIPPLCEREAERDCHYYIGPDVRHNRSVVTTPKSVKIRNMPSIFDVKMY